MNNASPNGRFPAASPWRSPIRINGSLVGRLVMSNKPGSTVLSERALPRRRGRSTYTDY